MRTPEELKRIVREKYAEIANQSKENNQASCCGAGDVSTDVCNIMTDDYSSLEGYAEVADLGLGCGLPTQFAKIRKGDTVVDLGSGAGNDCFVARHETGESGKVIGIDFTDAMIRKARENIDKLGFNNVEFRQGDIEEMPLTDNSVDVVVSNCVLNLVPNKEKVFSEIHRVLKPGGHFSISDIVLQGELPSDFHEAAELYAGCVTGASQKDVYMDYVSKAGFDSISIQKEKPIVIPDDILKAYLNVDQLAAFKSGESGIYSITIFAQKPGGESVELEAGTTESACCGPDCC